MRIDSIEVINFRGIRNVLLKDLGSTIVIAGANGSGKSCIFDAIRLLKSAYGGYQQNEWQQWMAEFQINFANNAESFSTFFQDKGKRLSIKCEFRLHANERSYLEAHGKELVRHSIWRVIAPEMYQWTSYNAAPMASQYRAREAEVAASTETQWAEMLRELSQDTVVGHLWTSHGESINFKPSKALEIIFSTFMPGELGLIDYHGAQRMYTREQVSGINLDLNVQEQNNKNHALYNYNNKYSNVKSEMASSYIKELLVEKSGVKPDAARSIEKTLSELFDTFFPEKKFLGLNPTAQGSLTFPVQTASGAIHDLNELSAGEKEVLYGYLRIRNSAPRYSVVLIDEPELHLNPRLVRGLPHFYHEHLGVALDNQIWLVTHSDALLREVVGKAEYSVFHMVGVQQDSTKDQIQRLTLEEDLERALVSLVGDIAAYRPGKKVVIFEGGGDTEFDVRLATELFPELIEMVNVISGGNKLRVRELHDFLEAAQRKGSIDFTVFSITDMDSDSSEVCSPRFKWDRYHIENYLLEPTFICKVLRDLDSSFSLNESDVYDLLRRSADFTLGGMVKHVMTNFVNSEIVKSINLACDPSRHDVAAAISESLQRSIDRIGSKRTLDLSDSKLSTMEQEFRTKFRNDLATDAWRRTFMGRSILKDFSSKHCSMSYLNFRDLIIARMKDAKFRPNGMKDVFEKIKAFP
jgi:predicted ATPase